jgi:hypothetical protein
MMDIVGVVVLGTSCSLGYVPSAEVMTRMAAYSVHMEIIAVGANCNHCFCRQDYGPHIGAWEGPPPVTYAECCHCGSRKEVAWSVARSSRKEIDKAKADMNLTQFVKRFKETQ